MGEKQKKNIEKINILKKTFSSFSLMSMFPLNLSMQHGLQQHRLLYKTDTLDLISYACPCHFSLLKVKTFKYGKNIKLLQTLNCCPQLPLRRQEAGCFGEEINNASPPHPPGRLLLQ